MQRQFSDSSASYPKFRKRIPERLRRRGLQLLSEKNPQADAHTGAIDLEFFFRKIGLYILLSLFLIFIGLSNFLGVQFRIYLRKIFVKCTNQNKKTPTFFVGVH